MNSQPPTLGDRPAWPGGPDMDPREKVLLIEDSEDYRELLKSRLDPFFQIHEADCLSRGMDMIHEASQRHDHYYCVLLDLTLPDSDRVSTVPAVTPLLPATTVMIISQHDDPEFVGNCIRWGAAGYLVKGKDDLDGAAMYRAIRLAVKRDKIETGLEEAAQVLHDTAHILKTK